MSFGFGVGDIITCIEMATKTIQALRSAGSEFEGLRLELSSLTATLGALEAEARGPVALIHSASMERQQQMTMLVKNCTRSMEELQGVVSKYQNLDPEKKTNLLQWMKFAAKDKRSPRDKLAIHTASINIFLTTLSHGSLAKLEFLIKNGRQAIVTPPQPDGPRGFNMATTDESSWSVHTRPTNQKRSHEVWEKIGNELADEGIKGQDLEQFQEEVKAYVRYLVRGETPFWKPLQFRRAEPFQDSKNKIMEYSEVRTGKTSTQPDVIVVEATTDASAARRERLRNELAEANRRPLGDVVVEARIQAAGAKLRYEKEEKRQKVNEREREERKTEAGKYKSRPSPKPTVEDDVVLSLAEQFDNLFELDGMPIMPPPSPIRESISELDAGVGKRRSPTSAARVEEIRRKLDKLLDRRRDYLNDKKDYKIRDLEMYAVPDQIELLQEESVEILNHKPWQWKFECDHCGFRIPGTRHHCGACDDGTWDICHECWADGVRCKDSRHEMLSIRDI